MLHQENKQSGKVKTTVYKKYVKAGGVLTLFIVFCVYSTEQFSINYSEKLISDWSNLENNILVSTNLTNSTVSDHRSLMFYMYTFLTVTAVVTPLGRGIAFVLFARKAALNLHKDMISSIVNASSRFFDANAVGNILNRFSKDVMTMDHEVPFPFENMIKNLLILMGIFALIAYANMVFLVAVLVLSVWVIVLRNYCLRTSTNLKRLEASTRSLVVGHLVASIEGLTTIRAFQAQNILRDEFDRHQDLHTSTSLIFQATMNAFAFIIDTVCGGFVSFIVLWFLLVEKDVSSGNVGLSIFQALAISNMFQWLIPLWTNLENSMTSVERVLEYTEIEQENKQGLELQHCGKQGGIKFRNVSLVYKTSHALKNITFDIASGEKIAIVGRTGSGKSSIIAALFRLYDVEGKIIIDGVDSKILSLHHLRTNISIIPQDPFLFAGSVRGNIDPNGKCTDENIWEAVRKLGLEQLIHSLEHEVKDGGSNFSLGQRQLICLARVMVQSNRIIVFDEATANVDPETEKVIFATMMNHFRHCTVLTVVHKLDNVMDNDKVVVLEKGEIIDYGRPQQLLHRQDGVFYQMMAKSGLLSKTC